MFGFKIRFFIIVIEIEVVIVESKEKIKIIFKDGLTVEENL